MSSYQAEEYETHTIYNHNVIRSGKINYYLSFTFSIPLLATSDLISAFTVLYIWPLYIEE
jgi:hypothetical protein